MIFLTFYLIIVSHRGTKFNSRRCIESVNRNNCSWRNVDLNLNLKRFYFEHFENSLEVVIEPLNVCNTKYFYILLQKNFRTNEAIINFSSFFSKFKRIWLDNFFAIILYHCLLLALPRYIIFHTLHLYWSSSTLRLLGVSVNFHKYTKLFLYNIVFISTFHMLTCCFISIHPLMLFVAWELSNCYEVKDTKKQSNWEPLPFLNSVTKRICIPRPGNNIILVISHNTIRIYDTRFRPLQIFKQLLYRSCSSIRY